MLYHILKFIMLATLIPSRKISISSSRLCLPVPSGHFHLRFSDQYVRLSVSCLVPSPSYYRRSRRHTILFFNSSDENIFVSSTLCLQSRIRSKQRGHHIIRRILFLSLRTYKGCRGWGLLPRPGRGMYICVETTVEWTRSQILLQISFCT